MTTPFNKDAWVVRALTVGPYRAGSSGTIYRANVKGILEPIKPRIHKKGRVYFNITFEGLTKSVLVNRAVALIHIPNPLGLPEVNHRDGVKAHNWKSNLEWSNRSEQEKHAFATGLKVNRGSANANAKLSADEVLAIRASSDPAKVLSECYNISTKTVRDIIDRKTWAHL